MNRVSNTCIVGRGRHTSSKPAKYMKYTYDTRANKMEEGRVTTQVKYRAIHDDTKFWGKTDPTFGEIRPPPDRGGGCHSRFRVSSRPLGPRMYRRRFRVCSRPLGPRNYRRHVSARVLLDQRNNQLSWVVWGVKNVKTPNPPRALFFAFSARTPHEIRPRSVL